MMGRSTLLHRCVARHATLTSAALDWPQPKLGGRHNDAYEIDLPIMSNVHRNRIDIIVAISYAGGHNDIHTVLDIIDCMCNATDQLYDYELITSRERL